eukprot:m.194922 g.194922  ORF g.194922 m.194922 type:complete len:96 (+) comp39511_c0_seq8:316-603(+)
MCSFSLSRIFQLRSSTDRDSYLINPLGLSFSEITASSLVKVNINGDIIDPGTTGLGINLTGYVLHSAIHGFRENAQCVAHVHTPAGAGVSIPYFF